MAKPMLLLALARSKTVRRLIGFLLALILVPVATVVLLIAVPVLASPEMGGSGQSRVTVVGEWGLPLAGDYFKSRGFGWDPSDGCSYCGRDHKGYDMVQPCGATVLAAGPGTVIHAGSWGGYGNAVQIDHGGGVTTIYGHFMWNSLFVQTGQAVVAGTPLGLEGTTGTSTGCHLHFEVRIDDVAVDPAPFMAARGLPLQ